MSTKFDAFSRAFVTARSRRGVLRGVIGVALGAGALGAVPLTTEARRQNRTFIASGTGTLRQPLPAGCDLTPQGCTLKHSGTGRMSGVGPTTFAMTMTADWLNSTPNGDGGRCAPMTGRSTLRSTTGPRIGAIGMQLVGRLCEVGPTVPDAPLTVKNGRFKITAGSGSFKRAKGNGRFFADTEADSLSFSANGRIIY